MHYHKLESILSVAKSLFAKYGLRKTSLEEVAKLARVAKGTIYNYFGSKDGVYREVLAREVEEVIKGLKDDILAADGPVEALKQFIFAKRYHIRRALNLFKVESGEVNFPEARKIREDFFQQELSLLEKILGEGIEGGIFDGSEPRTMAKSILLALKGFEKVYLRGEIVEDVEETLQKFVSIMMKGILRQGRV